MESSLLKSEAELIKMKYLSRLRYLEFQIYLNEIKYKMALYNLERKKNSLNESNKSTYGRIYFYEPVKLINI